MRKPTHRVLSPPEYKKLRRERRLDRNLREDEDAQGWAQRRGFSLRILNGGHHWLLEGTSLVAEWWPSSGLFVLNRNYSRSFHFHLWSQVKAFLEGRVGPHSSKPLH